MKHLLFTILLVIIGIRSAHAYDFEVDGIYYNIVSSTDLTCEVTKHKMDEGYSGEITIPSKVNYDNQEFSVIAIGERAFSWCLSLTSVEIPNSVTSIGEAAFAGCLSLTSIFIPNSITNIESFAFRACSSLISIEIPNSVNTIMESVFHSCI